MVRFSALFAALATLAIVIAGCGQAAGAGPAGTAAAGAATTRPSFDLQVTGGPGAGVYKADPAASLNSCRKADGGSWSLLYAGGTPFVNIDLIVGSGVDGSGTSNRVGLELNAGPGYLRFDPAQLRGGDRPGRSTATVAVKPGSVSTTMIVDANTPDGSSASDAKAVRVQLTVTCPG